LIVVEVGPDSDPVDAAALDDALAGLLLTLEGQNPDQTEAETPPRGEEPPVARPPP
jgi:hypothetical protein